MASGTQYLPGGGTGTLAQIWGIYQAYIAVNNDPLSSGRVKLRVPQVFGTASSGWATPMVPLSYVPPVGTQVQVMFTGGDPAQPVWFGNFAIAGEQSTVTGQGPPPASPNPVPPVGTLYFDLSNGNAMYEWNGVQWIAYQIGGAAIQSGVALNLPNITGGTITGAKFVATGTSGEILAYSGTPASGNMVASVSATSGTDAQGNTYQAGVTSYSSPGVWGNLASGALAFNATISGIGTYKAGLGWFPVGASLAQVMALYNGTTPYLGIGNASMVSRVPIGQENPRAGAQWTGDAWTAVGGGGQNAVFTNSWTGAGTLRYKLTTDGMLHIVGRVTVPSGYASGQQMVNFAVDNVAYSTLYRTEYHEAVYYSSSSTESAAMIALTTAGALFAYGGMASGNTLVINARIPLDVPV